MTDKVLYVLAIPEESQTKAQGTQRRNVSQQGAVSGGSGNTKAISTTPGEKRLTGWFRGTHAEEMAQEIEELFGAPDISEVPFRGLNGTIKERGYYALRDITVQLADPRDTRAQTYDGAMVKKGTRRNHWRAVQTRPKQVENDFGNDTTGYIGVPSTASKVRWFDQVGGTGSREDPTVQATRDTEFGTIDIIDTQAASFSEPTAIYDIPYDEEGKLDAKVWDDRGMAKTDADDVVQWTRVFDPSHEYEGNPIVENAILRLEFDEANNTLSTWRWDEANSTYASVSLGTSDWELFDADNVLISGARIKTQLEFRDPTQSPTAYFSLDATVRRGYKNAQWVVPPNESGPVPSGLQTLLDPIANESVISPDEQRTLVERQEVRK